jgi:hypothetical protein
MKITLRRIILSLIAALIFLTFALVVSLSSYGSFVNNPSGQKNDSIFIHKNVFSKYHRIGLYPDATQKVVFFTVHGEQGKVYELYLFDLQGNLVKQSEIRNRQTTFIKDIDKGVYVFDVFCDDDKIGNGEIAVR